METAIKTPISWVGESGIRLDASFYAGTGQKQARAFIHSNIEKTLLHRVTVDGSNGIYIPSRFKRMYVENEEHGYPYITGSGIVQEDPLQGCRYISRKYTRGVQRLLLKPGTIVVTCSGNIGNVAFIPDFLEGAVGSPDLIRIIPDPQKMRSGYLYSFLTSEVGRALITQHTYGSVVQHVEAHHLYDLPVPVLDPRVELEIHNSVVAGVKKRSTAYDAIHQARHRVNELLK